MGENMRLIIDIMEHTKSENIPGILVSLDFRKAFDSRVVVHDESTGYIQFRNKY